MSQSKHNLEISAKDNTAAAFKSIEGRAASAGSRVAKIMGGAIAAAGAYLSFRSAAGAVKELGKLSDAAARAGTSVSTLTRMAAAYEVAGINLGVDQLTRAFEHLQKATGEGGEDHFYAVLRTISAIEDPAERGAELVKNFGRAGLDLLPLVANGGRAVEKMRLLASVMPGVSDSAAQAGDAAADALTELSKGAQSLMLNAVGKICSLWGADFPDSVRAGALNAVSYIDWFLRKAYNMASKWGARIANQIGAIYNWAANDYSWEDAQAEAERLTKLTDADFDSRLAAADARRKDYLERLKKAFERDEDEDDKNKGSGSKEAAGETTPKQPPRINNPLITAGSYAQQRLAILGPEYQNEAKRQTAELKKQNELLKKVVDNTAKTAEESADTVYQSTDLGA